MKNYLVIGGSSGIGKATEQLLAKAGHKVYATFNRHHIETDSQIIPFQLNVMEEIPEMDLLPNSLDGFVYCPRSIQLRPFVRIKPESFGADFELQVGGAIKILQHILPRLKAVPQASMLFFSTVAVQIGFNFHSQVAMNNGAIEGLTRSLAVELAPNIRVNAIAPSLTDTPLAVNLLSSEEKKEANAQRHPLKKFGQAENLAEMACFLLSDRSSWITGQIIHVDGGSSSINL